MTGLFCKEQSTRHTDDAVKSWTPVNMVSDTPGRDPPNTCFISWSCCHSVLRYIIIFLHPVLIYCHSPRCHLSEVTHSFSLPTRCCLRALIARRFGVFLLVSLQITDHRFILFCWFPRWRFELCFPFSVRVVESVSFNQRMSVEHLMKRTTLSH